MVVFCNKIWNFAEEQGYAALKGKGYELGRIHGLISLGMGYTGNLCFQSFLLQLNSTNYCLSQVPKVVFRVLQSVNVSVSAIYIYIYI